MLSALSRRLARAEEIGAGFFALLVTLLIVFNVITRAANQAVFWIDEAAIYAMVWMMFLATSVLHQRRQAVAVTVLVDPMPAWLRRLVGIGIDWTVLLFALLLLWFCWIWFDPPGVIRHGFDLDAFTDDTMNFIYQDRASTLPIQKFWVWLIMPYFALSMALHALANIVDSPRGRHMDPQAEAGAP